MRIGVFGLSLALLVPATTASAQVERMIGSFASGQVLVKFKPGFEAQGYRATASIEARIVDEVTGLRLNLVELPEGVSVPRAVAYYRSLPQVEYAEPNYRCEAFYTPNDASFSTQYAPQKIQCPAGWDRTRGSSSVVIAIIDTGIDLNHPDLSGKIVPGYDFVNRDASPQDDNGHGTHCAGIAAAKTDNSIGIAGVGFNCSLMGVKVLDQNGAGWFSDVASGIVWATDHGAKVLSLSLGGTNGSAALADAVNYAWSRNVVICAAAGNGNTTNASYPAYYTNCIAVASSQSNDTRSSFSSYGSWVDVAAPGQSIYSTYLGGGYRTLSGTSMATPAVAGLAGLVWSRLGTSASASSVRRAIEDNCDPVGNWVAKGRVNAARALGGIEPAPALADFVVNPQSFVGPLSPQGTVTIDRDAPAGGTSVSIISANPNLLSVPATVLIPQGGRQATFSLNGATVTNDTNIVVTASAGGASRNVTVTIRRYVNPALDSLTLSQNAVTGPANVTGTAQLNTAPNSPMVVSLSSSNPSVASVPSSVTVPAGSTAMNFNVSCAAVSSDTTVTITGSGGGQSRQVQLRVVAAPPALQSITLNRTWTIGGTQPFPIGTVTLTAPAPSGGAVISLSVSSYMLVNAPTTLTIPAGQRSKTFTLTTYPVTSTRTAIVTATWQNVRKTVNIDLYRR
jgi:thermitase